MPFGATVGAALNPNSYLGTAHGGQAAINIWNQWIVASSNATSATSYAGNITTSSASSIVWTNWVKTETPEEKKKRLEYERKAHIRQKWERRRADRINRTANELLLTHLTEEQRKTFKERGMFIVEGGKSKKKYEIRTRDRSVHGNVYEKNEKGEIIGSYCFQLSGQYPLGDHWLAQKLSLELDEEETMKIANFTRYNMPRAA
jgi:hypothetical protein